MIDRYLSPPDETITVPVDALAAPPPGLTVPELTAWCGWADDNPTACSFRNMLGELPPRARLCIWNATTNGCDFRVIRQADYAQYAPHKANFKSTTHAVVYPSCFLWVSWATIDPLSTDRPIV